MSMKKKVYKMLIFACIILGVLLLHSGVRVEASEIHALCVSGYPLGNNNSELMYDRIVENKLQGYKAGKYVKQYTYNSEKPENGGGSSESDFDSKISEVIQNSSSRDILIFYYYGHTVSDGTGSSLGFALTGSKKACDTWYRWQHLALMLAQFPGKIYVILDTCHAEDFWTQGVSSILNQTVREKFSCLLACGSNESSNYGPKLLFTTPRKLVDAKYYGSFTFNIGKALGYWNGILAADRSKNGYVTLNELYAYVEKHISGFDKMTVKTYGGYLDEPLFHYNVAIDHTKLSMNIKDQKKLCAYVTGTKVKAKWTSSNTSVATVNSGGKVVAQNPGTAVITAKINGTEATCTVKVKDVKYTLSQFEDYNRLNKLVHCFDIPIGFCANPAMNVGKKPSGVDSKFMIACSAWHVDEKYWKEIPGVEGYGEFSIDGKYVEQECKKLFGKSCSIMKLTESFIFATRKGNKINLPGWSSPYNVTSRITGIVQKTALSYQVYVTYTAKSVYGNLSISGKQTKAVFTVKKVQTAPHGYYVSGFKFS